MEFGMETICVWNTCMEIPLCLGLGWKNPNQSVFFFFFFKFVLRLVCFWLNNFW